MNLVAHRGQLRLGLLDRDLERSLINTKKHLTGCDPVIVVNIDFDDAAGYVGADRDTRGLDIGIIGRDITPTGQVPVAAGKQNDERTSKHQRQPYPLPQRPLAPRYTRTAVDGGPARTDRRCFVFDRSRHRWPPTSERSAAVIATLVAARSFGSSSSASSWTASGGTRCERFPWTRPRRSIRCCPSASERPAKASVRTSVERSRIRLRIGRAFAVRTRRRARRSPGSGRRSIQPSSSIRSICRTKVIGLISSRSASPAWLMPSLRARYPNTLHCARVRPRNNSARWLNRRPKRRATS